MYNPVETGISASEIVTIIPTFLSALFHADLSHTVLAALYMSSSPQKSDLCSDLCLYTPLAVSTTYTRSMRLASSIVGRKISGTANVCLGKIVRNLNQLKGGL